MKPLTRFVVAESLILVCLLLVASYTLEGALAPTLNLDSDWLDPLRERAPGLDNSVIFVAAIAVVYILAVAYYWGLQILEKTRLSFWSVALTALLIQTPAILAHNRLDWTFLLAGPEFSTDMSLLTVLALFLLSLILLVTLHRVADLRRLWFRMQSLQLDSMEQTRITTAELLTMGGLVGVSLAATGLLLTGGLALARMSDLLSRSPWTVLTVGVAALILLAAFMYFWVRIRDEA